MAAFEIKNHFKGLRVQTARRRTDPFATGFEDDSDDPQPKRRARSDSSRSSKPESGPSPELKPSTTGASPSHALDALQDNTDDDFLSLSPKRIPQPSPRLGSSLLPPNSLASRTNARGAVDAGTVLRDPRGAVALAAGSLAYLDESSDEEPDRSNPSNNHGSRPHRRPSPAPHRGSDLLDPTARSLTPRGTRSSPSEHSQIPSHPPRHTVASAFAGTKYLQDSDSDEDAVSSRHGSTDNAFSPEPEITADFDDLTPYESAFAASKKKHLEVKRVDKPKNNGSGVSWRAFSAGRTEQRSAEIEALQTSLKQRGKSIAFGTHAITDDGKWVPIPARTKSFANGGGRAQLRGKSPPRRAEDIIPDDDEFAAGLSIRDSVEYRINPASVTPPKEMLSNPLLDTVSQTSASTTWHSPDDIEPLPISPTRISSAMTGSADSILSRLTVSPLTIPEGKPIQHSISPIMSSPAVDHPLSRDSSTRSTRISSSRAVRASQPPRRLSRRSTSHNASASPAAAFLSSWGSKDMRGSEPVPEPKPDDEGQAIGLNGEYIIGRRINEGGFGVIKEVHSIRGHGEQTIAAVKIVRKLISGRDEAESDKAQQDLEHEVSVWRHLKHRHILSLTAVYETDFATFCVMDLNVGGTLFDVLRQSRAAASQNDGRMGVLPEMAKSYAHQLACALRYLHEDVRVCHRDVKLENCLIDLSGPSAETEGGLLRLCDFGLADFLQGDHGLDDDSATPMANAAEGMDMTSSVIGTLEYASPKGLSVNRKLFETAGDVWAFGVIAYALCTGDLPFRHPMPAKTVGLILDGEWDDTALRQAAAGSDAVIELVRDCLEKDIDRRLMIREALRSPWFASFGSAEEESRGSGPWA